MYCPTTAVTTSVERLISELNTATFSTSMNEAAKAGWSYVVLSSGVIEGLDALEWAIPQLLATELFASNPFKLLVRGELSSSEPLFEFGVSWGDTPDINFIENTEELECDWIDPDESSEIGTFESESDRLSNPTDIVNKVLSKFTAYKTTTTPTELYTILISAYKEHIDKYESNEFDVVILDNIRDTMLRYTTQEWKKDTQVLVSALWPFGEGVTIRSQWLMSKLSDSLVPLHFVPIRITTPDGEHIGLIHEHRIVFHFDI